MSRTLRALLVGAAVLLAACSGGGSAQTSSGSACPLLADLARTGETVATADVSDPAAFDATLRAAVKKYVRTAERLRDVAPPRLRSDVDRIIAAAQQYRFQDGTVARSNIDEYARTECGTNASGS